MVGGIFCVNFCIIKKSIYWIDISLLIESWIFFSFCWSYISQSLHFLYFVDLYFNLLVLLLFIFTSIDIYNIICFVDMFKNLYFLSLAISKNEELCYMYLPISIHAGLNVRIFFSQYLQNVDVPIKNTYEYYCSIYKMIFCNLRYFCLKEVWNILRAIFV